MNWLAAVTKLIELITALFVTPKKQVQKVVEIYDCLHEIIDTTSVERVLVLKAHNGGGVIKPTGSLYATALYEDHKNPPFKSQRDSFQRFPVDKEYAKMLLDVMENKKINLITSAMPDSQLKTIYQAEGVINSRVYFLAQDKKCIYYMSVASSHDWPIGPQESVCLDILVNKIQKNIK